MKIRNKQQTILIADGQSRLRDCHDSINRTVSELLSLRQGLGELESRKSKADVQAIALVLAQIKQVERTLADLQAERCRLVESAVAARFAEIRRQSRADLDVSQKLAEQQQALLSQAEALQPKIQHVLSQEDELKRLTKRTVSPALAAVLTGELQEFSLRRQAVCAEGEALTGQIEAVRLERGEVQQRIREWDSEVDRIMSSTESLLGELSGNLQDIERSLEDPFIVADRLAMRELIDTWKMGIVRTETTGQFLQTRRDTVYTPSDCLVLFWLDSGALATSIVFEGRAVDGSTWKPASRAAFSLEDTKRNLEATRKVLKAFA